MKKLFLTVFIVFLAAFASAAISKFHYKRVGPPHASSLAGKVCIDGYQFAFLRVQGNNGVALVQIQESTKTRGFTIMMKCNN